VALTALTVAHAAGFAGVVAEKFTAIEQSVEAPLQKLRDQPPGYVISARDVSFTFVGSISWTISWLIVPAPTTGMDAVRLTLEHGATVAVLVVKVTDVFEALAKSARSCKPPATTRNASNRRLQTPERSATSPK